MTAEEKGLALFDAWLEDKGDDEVFWVAAIAAAIGSAEAAAYERAAKECDAYADEMAGKPMDLTAKVAAQCTAGACANRVRALATKETP